MRLLIPTCRTKKITFSCSLNPNPKEKLSDETLVELAREYMEKLGYGNQPFIVFKHFDIDREHIHIVSTRVGRNGRKIKDSFEEKRSRNILDKLELKYGLIPTPSNKLTERPVAPIELSEEDTDYEPSKTNKPKREKANTSTQTASVPTPLKENKELLAQMRSILNEVLKKWHFQSIGELNAILSRYNLTAELTKNEHNDKLYNGIVYTPTNSVGEKIGTPLSGSHIGRGFGHTAVLNRFKVSKEEVEGHLPKMVDAISLTMAKKPKSIEAFQKQLSTQGYEVVFRTNDKGRIYGITFIDTANRIVANGSRLGKAYSANVFNAYFYEGLKWSPDVSVLKADDTLFKSYANGIRQPFGSRSKSSYYEDLLGYNGDGFQTPIANNSNFVGSSIPEKAIQKDEDISISDITDLIEDFTQPDMEDENKERAFQHRLKRQAQKATSVKRRRR